MPIYGLHSHHGEALIEEGCTAGHISGVVLSPRYAKPGKMRDFVSSLRRGCAQTLPILFDPQFFFASVSGFNFGNLEEYGYIRESLDRSYFWNTRHISDIVGTALSCQLPFAVHRLVSPTIEFHHFGVDDFYYNISMQMLEAAIDAHATMTAAPPLLISLVFDEAALSNREGVYAFLDYLTLKDVCGFYIILDTHDQGYPKILTDATQLANFMYIVHVLAGEHDFEVVCSYTDIVAPLLYAVGVTATATGQSKNLRKFSLQSFQPRAGGGGGPIREQYTSSRLLTSLTLDELGGIFQGNQILNVLSGTQYDRPFQRSNPTKVEWNRTTACLHHWEVLNSLTSAVVNLGSVSEKLQYLEQIFREADQIYQNLSDAGIGLHSPRGTQNIDQWQTAIREFRTVSGVA